MDVLTTIVDTSWLFLLWIGVISLIVGSFLNVVIHRLPIMMDRESHRFCHDYFERKKPLATNYQKPFNLMWPLSHCPKCSKAIKPWHNIPIISYLFLKSRCASCSLPISIRYPLIELGCCLSSVFIAWYLGPSWQAFAALFFNWILICLLFIDIDHQLLPDNLTICLLWSGLISSIFNLFVPPATAIMGAVAGYMVFWLVASFFKVVTGKEGMGHGDFKLLAALGAWLGWQNLPLVVLVSSAAGLVATLLWCAVTKRDCRGVPIPFGPFLVFAGWVGLLWGDYLNTWYLSYMGLI